MKDPVKAARIAFIVLSASAIVAFAWTVWPTLHRYHQDQETVYRENRFTGALEWLSISQGWLPIPAKPNPPTEAGEPASRRR